AYIAGEANPNFNAGFPSICPVQAAPGGGVDAFVIKLSADGTFLDWSTLLGGSGLDIAKAIAVDPAGNVVLAGYTTSTDFLTANVVSPVFRGGSDAFAAKISA